MKTTLLSIAFLMAITLVSCESENPESFEDNTTKEALDLPSNDLPLTINGSNTFQQVAWSQNYVIPGESTPIPGDHTLTIPNPILSEQDKYNDYASNVPLDLEVTNAAFGDWYQQYTYNFTNRSNETFHVDSGILMFIAPNKSNGDRFYGNSKPFGHPQQDYVEVPIEGTPNSWYIARLVFHDVSEEMRAIEPGETWIYKIGTPTDPFNGPGWITTEESKKTVRFIADLTGNKNEDIVRKYGTKRFRN